MVEEMDEKERSIDKLRAEMEKYKVKRGMHIWSVDSTV